MKAVADLLPVAEKAHEVWVGAEKRVRSLEMKLSLVQHREASFDETVTAVNKELSVARVGCATLL